MSDGLDYEQSNRVALYEVEVAAMLAAIKYAEGFDKALDSTMAYVQSAEIVLHMQGDEPLGTLWWDGEQESWRFIPARLLPDARGSEGAGDE